MRIHFKQKNGCLSGSIALALCWIASPGFLKSRRKAGAQTQGEAV
jgi:hypothetical protein